MDNRLTPAPYTHSQLEGAEKFPCHIGGDSGKALRDQSAQDFYCDGAVSVVLLLGRKEIGTEEEGAGVF